ncbi:MAG: DNA primase [Puniceicoccales bacterium]|nr:DNA primase [Puniceicoccales bacterium]
MIARECLEHMKEAVDICDVISPYVNLKKCGANWRGLSPFNSEKTPSFFVMPARKMFRCFSSGNAGDIFRFIQLKENVSFCEAAEIIANRFNIPLKFDSRSHGDQPAEFSKKDLFTINELANVFFTKSFHGNDAAGQKIRHYWTEVRQFSLETANRQGIGLCKNDEKCLIDALVRHKLPIAAIKQSGLFYAKDEDDVATYRLRFRFRLTMPIRDIQGRIVGFSARIVEGLPAEMLDAKYVNSPETPIFRKSNILFGLHEARLHIGAAEQFWLVEGPFDVFRCWEAGMLTAIAPQGTAIGDAQLSTLRRYSPNLNCLLDGDDAGLRAADRLLPMAMAAGLEAKFYVLPKGEDPDSFFKKQGKNIALFLESGISAMEFAAKRYFPDAAKMSSQNKADALQKVYEIIASSDSSIVHESLLDEVSRIGNFDRRALAQDFATFYQRKKFNSPLPIKSSIESNNVAVRKLDSAESQLLAIILSDVQLGKKIAAVLDVELVDADASPEAAILVKILSEIAENLWEGMEALNNSATFSEEEKNIAYSVLADFNCEGDPQTFANLSFSTLHSRFIKKKINELNEKISKISLDEKEMLRNLQRDKMYLRGKLLRPPWIDVGMRD